MGFILLIVAVFLVSRWLISKAFAYLLYSESDNDNKQPKTTIHNHITENHLHITDEQLKRLVEKD